MTFKSFLLIAVFTVVSDLLYAQSGNYQFSHLDIKDGLSSNQVNCIYKDAKGFMWFGTSLGINRYDGYNVKIFKHDEKNPNSLANDYIVRICEGPENKIWFYTYSGYSIYDPVTESFNNNTKAEFAKYGVLTNDVTLVKKDNSGNYWFVTDSSGLYCYNPKNHVTNFYNKSARAKATIHSNNVSDAVQEKSHCMWLIHRDGIIEKLNTVTNSVTVQRTNLHTAVNIAKVEYRLTIDDDNLWIRANSNPIGVYLYNTNKGILKHFDKDSPLGSRLNLNVISTLIQGDDNKMWVGTDHGGINLIDRVTYKVTYLEHKDDDPKSLRGNSINLYRDRDGMMWAGSYKQGISYYHKGMFQFQLVKQYASDPSSLPFEDVTTLLLDHLGKLWIGTYYGGLDYFDGERFIHHHHSDKDSTTISDDRIFNLHQDGSNKIWIGAFVGGINVYDYKTQTFSRPYTKNKIFSEYLSVVYGDHEKNIWLAGYMGLHMINRKTGEVTSYIHNSKNPNSIIDNRINSVIQDNDENIWICTRSGISILNKKTNSFKNISLENGLPSNNVLKILQDKKNRLWISTANGLSKISVIKTNGSVAYKFNNYDELDGLQGREFNINAGANIQNGKLIFGGSQGFNMFDPDQIKLFAITPNLVFTDFQLFNNSVIVGDTINGSVVLKKSIAHTQALTLNHNQNVFSIEFAALDFFNPNKIQYEYQMEGFDKNWLVAKKNLRRATYTNLYEGDYTFKVRAVNLNDPSKSKVITLKIKILPPFWRSPLAYLLYFILAISSLFYLRHRGIQKLKKEFDTKQKQLEAERKLTQEREEAKRMHELDLMKIKFFTNVSHEFRTPLSLITSPVDKLIKDIDKPEQQQQLLMIQRNGKRLLNLVNQLLDFRKMEFKELKLNLTKGDIISFIKDAALSFTDLAQQNNINFLVESDRGTMITYFDQDKIERTLFNVLSNAFKFTPSGGQISVLVSILKHDHEDTANETVEIKIIDTGIGIQKDKHEKIFERFFQDSIPEKLLNQGTGIGLSITKEFVKMHGGEINVESEQNVGSCFTILLPVKTETNTELAVVGHEQAYNNVFKEQQDDPSGMIKKPVILIVEDNTDLRFYLKDNLKNYFNIIEASNGREGWQKALALHPKLIVSDISMPEMSGVELCKKLKGDVRTVHIPVILLTALSTDDDHLLGLDSGATDYITKPFNFEILLSKIQNLLSLQEVIKKTSKKQVDVQLQEITIESEDEKFVKSAVLCVESNITNPNFSVEELSRQLGLSRVSLYKKVLNLTGKTPVDFIRNIRLKKSVQLLQKSKLGIAQIAYEVGFNNPNYFAKVFREEFGKLPSDYLADNRKHEKDVIADTADVNEL